MQNQKIEDMKQEIKELKEEIAQLIEEKDELESQEESETYDEIIDSEGPVDIGTLTFDRSRILKELDPIAYGCGLNDFNDERLTQIDEEIDEKETAIKDLENEIYQDQTRQEEDQ